MKILFLDSPAFAKQDMLGAFGECGITCDLFFHNAYHDRKNTDFDNAFDAAVESNSYDFVFSFNYFPILSNNCRTPRMQKIEWDKEGIPVLGVPQKEGVPLRKPSGTPERK